MQVISYSSSEYNICEPVVKERQSTVTFRQWFLNIVNEDTEEKVEKLSKEFLTPLAVDCHSSEAF